jgi:hypothetical protein
MDIFTITKEYEDCVLKIEKSTKRYVGTHFASSLLRELTKTQAKITQIFTQQNVWKN